MLAKDKLFEDMSGGNCVPILYPFYQAIFHLEKQLQQHNVISPLAFHALGLMIFNWQFLFSL